MPSSTRLLLLALLAGGCSARTLSGSSDSATGSGGSDGTTGATATSSTGTTSASTTGPTTVTTTTTTTDPQPPPDFGDGGGGAPNGASCENDWECQSGKCFYMPVLGGLCGECLEDAECPDGGCTPPKPVADPPVGAECNDGGLGAGCESIAACQMGLSCRLMIDVSGILVIQTCGECVDDQDCGVLLCSPSYYSFADAAMYARCRAPGSVGLDEGCDLDGSGDLACASGICGEADLMGLATVGLCGQCRTDADCGAGTCDPAFVDLPSDIFQGSRCVP